MSFLEILIVILISCTILDIKDIRYLFKKLLSVQRQVKNLKSYIMNLLEVDDNIENLDRVKKIDQMNFMLKKIVEIEGEYKGEYSLKAVRLHYNKIEGGCKND